MGKVGDAVDLEPYGFHANAPVGTLGMIFSMQGRSEGRVAMAVSPAERIKPLAATEFVWAHPPTGTKIHWRADGSLDIETANADVNINTGTGDFNVDAADINLTSSGTITMTATTGVHVSTPTTLFTSDVVIGPTHDLTMVNGDFLIGTGTLTLAVGTAAFTTSITSAGVNIGDQHIHELISEDFTEIVYDP